MQSFYGYVYGSEDIEGGLWPGTLFSPRFQGSKNQCHIGHSYSDKTLVGKLATRPAL